MARGVITKHTLGRSGTTTITYVTGDATNDHQFDNATGEVAILIKNGTAAPVTVTFVTAAVVEGSLAVEDLVVSVAVGAVAIVGPFPKGIYDQAGEVVNVDPSVTDAALKMAAIAY